MKLSTLMSINAVLAFVFGLAFVLVPTQTLSLYGPSPDATLKYVAQLLGAAFIGFGVLTWAARSMGESEARKAIVLSLFISEAVGFVIALVGQLGGVVNTLGWSTVAIYLLLAVGWGYFRFVKPGP